MNTKTTGQFISKKRKEKKMTQSELAEILQVTDKAISRWETGEGYPEVTILPKLAYTLGVSVDELLNGDQAIGCETTSVKVISLFEMISRVSLAFILFGLLIGIGLIYLKEDKFVSLIPLSIGWFIGFVIYQYGKYQFIRASVFNDLDKFTISSIQTSNHYTHFCHRDFNTTIYFEIHRGRNGLWTCICAE
ncbi:MAG: helix-turn-helix transcriptional regulator [Acholeplasma sp.]|nr:helix-turn-helix transcriptional regulator [Acholeplasma sp.]